jgi:polysaccharide export outer membrane protein
MRSIRFAILVCLLIWAGSRLRPRAQEPLQSNLDAGQPANARAFHSPLLIGPGDLLNISAYDAPEYTQDVRVEDAGEIHLNLIGATKVGGMTAEAAGIYIADQLDKRHFLIHPQVTVLVKEFATRTVSVSGEVQHPGVYPMLTTKSILDVIALAGGWTNIADSRVAIKHRSGQEERVTVKLKGDDAQSQLDQNVLVYPGDLVVVPRAGLVYVLGDVGRPGGIVMQDNGSITVIEALAQAGGANHTAALNSAVLLHKTESGYSREKVKLNDLMQGHLADETMRPSDILFVPGSRLKYLAENSQSIASSAIGATVYHAIP